MQVSSHLIQVRLQTWGKCGHPLFFFYVNVDMFNDMYISGWQWMMLDTFTQHLHHPLYLLYMDVGCHFYFFQMRIIVTFGIEVAIFTVVIHDSKFVIQSAVAIRFSPIHVSGGVLSISDTD